MLWLIVILTRIIPNRPARFSLRVCEWRWGGWKLRVCSLINRIVRSGRNGKKNTSKVMKVTMIKIQRTKWNVSLLRDYPINSNIFILYMSYASTLSRRRFFKPYGHLCVVCCALIAAAYNMNTCLLRTKSNYRKPMCSETHLFFYILHAWKGHILDVFSRENEMNLLNYKYILLSVTFPFFFLDTVSGKREFLARYCF